MTRAGARRPLLLLLFCCWGAIVCSPGKASPWARDDGRIFISTRTNYFAATAGAPLPGASAPARFERFDTDTYVEFGLTRRVTIGGKAVYGTSSYDDGINTLGGSGFTEIEGFVQRAIWRSGRDAFALRLAAAAPAELAGPSRPGLANDGADLELRALYGRNIMLRPFKVFAAAEAGYRRRFGEGADQMRADLLIGAEPLQRALVLVEIFSSTSLRNEAPGGADYDVLKIQPSLVYRLTRRWSVQAGVTHEAWGRNLLTGDAYFFGLWTRF